jgi:alpha-beta hydrolase superfamily lysophospholipase
MSDSTSKTAAISFVENLLRENYSSCENAFSAVLKEQLSQEKLRETWEGTIAGAGRYVRTLQTMVETKGSFDIVQVYLLFEGKGIVAILAYREERIQGITFNHFDPQTFSMSTDVLPKDVEEVTVTIGQNHYPLPGKLTRTTGQQSRSAVVLVHGSGPQDMDETILGNKPFRDLAWGLTKSGIDVLRYDKRTYAHTEEISKTLASQFTVYEETIEDAILAGRLLVDMGYERIFLAGHSLGGMLAPRIQTDSDGLFAGIIILAGSPRTLTDIILDQNNDSISSMPDEQRNAAQAVIQAEKQKLAAIDTMTDEQLTMETVFSMPGHYVKDMNAYDTFEIAANISEPVLVLQGALDFQVYAEKDFSLWKVAFKDNPLAQFVLYEGLGHLFTAAPEIPTRTVADYTPPSHVSGKVIEDMTKFITETSLR